MGKQTLITSHRARVKRANDYVRKQPEKISIIDREAIVEHFLLEDIERLYVVRLNRAMSSPNKTRDGQLSGLAAQRILRATLHIVTSAIEVSKNKILLGRYSDVWKAIHEGPLMRAASNTKYIEEMKVMLEELLGQLSAEALEAVQTVIKREAELDEAEAHEANICALRQVSYDEFDAITNSVAVDIAETPNVKKNKSNTNTN